MITPAPLPDELDRGYWGRVIRWNGFREEKEAVQYIMEFLGVAHLTRKEFPLVELLSQVAGMDLPEFVQRHTTLPLRRGVTSYQPELTHGSRESNSMLWTSAMRVSRPGAYFCPHCVKADQQFHGFSYWRRELQIPGLFWCPKHAAPLHYVEKDTAFLKAPLDFVDQSFQVPIEWVSAYRNHPYIQKYLEISAGLLDRKQAFDVRKIAPFLKNEADRLGLQTYANNACKRPLLSDAVIDEFGSEWLASVFPALVNKPVGKLLDQMDGVLFRMTSASAVTAYILAAAVLFPSSDEALQRLVNATQECILAKRRSRKTVSVNEQELRERYILAKGSHAEVTGYFTEINDFVIVRRLNMLGLPNLAGKGNHGIWDAVYAFFVEGKTLADSASSGGIACRALEDLLRKAGAKLALILQEIQQAENVADQRCFIKLRQKNPHDIDTRMCSMNF